MGKLIFEDFIQLKLCRTIFYALHVFIDEYDNRVSSIPANNLSKFKSTFLYFVSNMFMRDILVVPDLMVFKALNNCVEIKLS